MGALLGKHVFQLRKKMCTPGLAVPVHGSERRSEATDRAGRHPEHLARIIHGDHSGACYIERGAGTLVESRIREMSSDARKYLIRRHRLGHIVYPAGIESLENMLGL